MRLFILFLLPCLLSLCSSISLDEEPLPLSKELVVMTYNIHHAAGSDNIIDIGRIARVITDADPDLVVLQEVDRFVRRSNRDDQAQQLADLTGMHMRFGFAINYQGGDFGNVILSKHPILSYETVDLPGDPGEDRVLMDVTIVLTDDVSAPDTISFLGTHLDTFSKPRDASGPLIVDHVPATPTHLHVLAGDLNAGLDTSVMEDLQTRFVIPRSIPPTYTYPASKPDRQIDYILYTANTGWKLDSLWVVSAPIASDHAPLVARFQKNDN